MFEFIYLFRYIRDIETIFQISIFMDFLLRGLMMAIVAFHILLVRINIYTIRFVWQNDYNFICCSALYTTYLYFKILQ